MGSTVFHLRVNLSLHYSMDVFFTHSVLVVDYLFIYYIHGYW